MVFSSNVLCFTEHLIRSSEKDVWLMDGSDIISILLNADLLDEIILSVHPMVLSKGIPLFKNVQIELTLKLLKSIPYDNGLVQLHYEL